MKIRFHTENASKQIYTFSHSYQPIYIVSRIFGLMPFSIELDSNGVIQRPAINKLDALWFLVSMIAYICIMYFSFEFFHSEKNVYTLTTISYVGSFLVFRISLILCLLAIILDMCFRFNFVDMFKKIAMFDQKVGSNV